MCFTEEQRRASQHDLSLSEESLNEYHRLYVSTIIPLTTCLNPSFSKAEASVLAVDERQALETLRRDAKAASRTYSQLRDKQEELEQQRDRLREDASTHGTRKDELEERVKSLNGDLAKVRQELDNRTSERKKSECV